MVGVVRRAVGLWEAVEVGVSDGVGDDVFDVANGPALASEDETSSGFVAVAPSVVVEFVVERDWHFVDELKREDRSEDDGVGGVIEELVDVVSGIGFEIGEASLDANRAPCGFERRFTIGDTTVDAVPGAAQRKIRAPAKQKELRATEAMAKDVGVDDVSCDRSHAALQVAAVSLAKERLVLPRIRRRGLVGSFGISFADNID